MTCLKFTIGLRQKQAPQIAISYIDRIEAYCLGFELASERGHRRDDISPDLRIVGFERRVAIAFAVDDDRVTILRLFYGGQNCNDLIKPDTSRDRFIMS